MNTIDYVSKTTKLQSMTLPGKLFGISNSSVLLAMVTNHKLNVRVISVYGEDPPVYMTIGERVVDSEGLSEQINELRMNYPQGGIINLPSDLFLQNKNYPEIDRVLLLQTPTEVYVELYDGAGAICGADRFPYDQSTKPELHLRPLYNYINYFDVLSDTH